MPSEGPPNQHHSALLSGTKQRSRRRTCREQEERRTRQALAGADASSANGACTVRPSAMLPSKVCNSA